MKLRRWLLPALLLASLTLTVPGPAVASWCGTAARFGGECGVCNGLCMIEALFDSLGGW